MQIGNRVLLRHNKELKEGIVIEIESESLHIKLDNEEIVIRKYWEVAKPKK